MVAARKIHQRVSGLPLVSARCSASTRGVVNLQNRSNLATEKHGGSVVGARHEIMRHGHLLALLQCRLPHHDKFQCPGKPRGRAVRPPAAERQGGQLRFLVVQRHVAEQQDGPATLGRCEQLQHCLDLGLGGEVVRAEDAATAERLYLYDHFGRLERTRVLRGSSDVGADVLPARNSPTAVTGDLAACVQTRDLARAVPMAAAAIITHATQATALCRWALGTA